MPGLGGSPPEEAYTDMRIGYLRELGGLETGVRYDHLNPTDFVEVDRIETPSNKRDIVFYVPEWHVFTKTKRVRAEIRLIGRPTKEGYPVCIKLKGKGTGNLSPIRIQGLYVDKDNWSKKKSDHNLDQVLSDTKDRIVQIWKQLLYTEISLSHEKLTSLINEYVQNHPKSNIPTKRCYYCNKPIYTSIPNKKYCSEVCGRKYRTEMRMKSSQ